MGPGITYLRNLRWARDVALRHFGTGMLNAPLRFGTAHARASRSHAAYKLQSGLEEMLERLNLTHAQREQVEHVLAAEALRLQMARGNPNLSVAPVFTQEQAIRIESRRQIAWILNSKQVKDSQS
jgi:hypothetical protein